MGVVVGGGVKTFGGGVTAAVAALAPENSRFIAEPLLRSVGDGGGVGIPVSVAPVRRKDAWAGTPSFAAAIAFARRSGFETATA